MNATLRRKSSVEITVRIGKHSDIAFIEENKNNILGRVVEICAMKELETGQYREARFKQIRLDKSLLEIN
jgi:hypothetical protein